MTYYRVKPEFDNTSINRIDKRSGKRMYYGFLVGNELYTEKELKRMKNNGVNGLEERKFTHVEIPKNNTHWFFGARFENFPD